MSKEELIEQALEAREQAYAPYSHFKVGAALLTKSGKVYKGCNVENAAFSATNCAERSAFFSAISQGEREFVAIAIVGGKEDATELELCPPCGICRQVMMEFCDYSSFEVVLAASKEDYEIFTLCEILPLGFGPDNL